MAPDEGEALALATLVVLGDVDVPDLPKLLEHPAQLILGGSEADVVHLEPSTSSSTRLLLVGGPKMKNLEGVHVLDVGRSAGGHG